MRKGFEDVKDPTILTRYGNPDYFIGKIDTVENLTNTINSLQSFNSSLTSSLDSSSNLGSSHLWNSHVSHGSILKATESQNFSNNPIVMEGGEIKYEKHSHKK